MNERQTDFELLREFVRWGDQPAFAAVVRRHLDLVFATALRKVEDQSSAEEVTQNVFAVLARKAWQFAPDDSLPAWLYRTTLLESKAWLRGELRRRRREQTAAELGTTMKTPDEQPALRALVPLLDEALLSLRKKDRTALLLRFYESLPLREVGASLGVGEDAAQKRVAGALQQLAQFFQRRGFRTTTITAVAAALQHTAASPPAVVVTSVVQAAMHVAPPAFAGTTALLSRVVGLTKIQKAFLCAALVAVPAVWHWNEVRQAEKEEVRKQTEIAAATAQAQRLQAAAQVQARKAEAARKLGEINVRSIQSPQPDKEYSVRLRGIIVLADFKAALLEIQHHSLDRSNAPPFVIHRVFREQETFDDFSIRGAYMRFELMGVGSENGSVEVREIGLERVGSGGSTVLRTEARESGEERRYELEDGAAIKLSRGAIAAICMADISFDDFLDLYGELTDRTILCHPMIKRQPSVSLAAPARNKLEAVRDLERTLQERGIETIRDGERFALLVPANLAKSISATVANTSHQTMSTNADVAKRAIDFINIDTAQLLTIYGALIDRKLIQSDRLPPLLFRFRNQTPLTKAETIHAFDTLLGWQGLKVVIVDAQSFKVVLTPPASISGKSEK